MVVGFTAALAAISIALLQWMGPTWPTPALGLGFTVIAIGFFAVESSGLHVEVRRQEHSLSLAAFPLVLGLLSLSPPMLVLSRLLGGGLALVVIKRRSGLKLAWTLALFAAETSVAAAIARPAFADGTVGGMSDWVTLLAALLVADLMRLVAVPVVIMIYEGGFRRSAFAQIGRGQTVAAVSATYSVVAAMAMVAEPAPWSWRSCRCWPWRRCSRPTTAWAVSTTTSAGSTASPRPSVVAIRSTRVWRS